MEDTTDSGLAMEGSHLQSGIRGDDHHMFRVYKAYTSEARLAFLQVLSWGCPKAPSQTFEQYLIESGLSRTSYRKAFNGQQREKISTNPSGDRFDISLLYKMIQLACSSLASPEDAVWTDSDHTGLEYLLTSIKNSRNALVHDVPATTQTMMVDEIEKLRDQLTKVVRLSGTLYCVNIRSVEQVLRRINYNLNNIRDQPFAPLDLRDYSSHLLFDRLRATLCLDGAQELKQTYGSKVFLNPLSFLDKSECHIRVGAVFIGLSIKDIRNSACRPVHYQELLELVDASTPDVDSSQVVEHDVQNPSLMILEGQPGSGKTTLQRLFISEWIAGKGDIKGLSGYDLVLHFECRDTCIDSLTQLLLSHMPQTTSKFRRNDLLHILLTLKVMVLVDGIDELNSASQKVLKEILHLKSSCDFTLICTSRAEKIREVYKMASGRVKVVHMKIRGIPIEKREEFVRVYHCQLKKLGVSQQDVDGLLDYLRQVPTHLQDFFNFPLNLVMLTFLWDDAHPRVRKITSLTALYLETHKLLIEKLLDRLMYHPSTQHLSLAKLTSKCTSFLAVMYEEALRALADGFVFLNGKATRRLREHCVSLDLPAEEMFSAFLVSASYNRPLALSEEMKFPHKGIQDFYAARHLTLLVEEGPFPDLSLFLDRLDELLRESSMPTFAWRQIVKRTRELLGQPIPIRSILYEFHEGQPETQYLGRYQNIIFHMISLLHSSGHHTLEHYAAEVVTLLDAKKGMSFEHWVDVLKETHYNPTLAKEISKVLPKFSWTVRDEHVRAAAAFLSHNHPSQLTIDLMNDPEKILHLYDLLEAVSTCDCKMYLYFHHHWRCPEAGLSDPFLLKLLPVKGEDSHPMSSSRTSSLSSLTTDYIRFPANATSNGLALSTRLLEMMGRFSGQAVQMLPTSIQELRLAIADDHDALDWFGALPKISQTLPSLRSIWVHVAAGVSPDLLPCLPQLRYRPRLYLSSVGDDNISWASRVARSLLLPRSKYATVGLVRSNLSSRGVNQLAELLRHLEVGVYAGRGGGLLVASAHLTDSDCEIVSNSVHRYLKCPFALLNDDDIWCDESIYEGVYEYHLYENRRGAAGNSEGSQSSYINCSNDLYVNPEEVGYVNLHNNSSDVEESEYLYVKSPSDDEGIYTCIKDVTEPRAPPLPSPRKPASVGKSSSTVMPEPKAPPLPSPHAPSSVRKTSSPAMTKLPVYDNPSKPTRRLSRPPFPLPPPFKLENQPPKPDPSPVIPPRPSPKSPPVQLPDPISHRNPRPAPLPSLELSRPHPPLLQRASSKSAIPAPLNLNSRPHQELRIDKPMLPCPLSPKFRSSHTHSLSEESS